MGIKDWFGGDKKKSEFREKAKEALAKGRLTPGKAAELDKLRQEHEVEDAGDDKTMLRREIYNQAVGAVKAGGKLTGTESAELAKIQKFLALRDDQVEKTKWDLARLRTLTEIRQGKLPVVPKENAALRGVQLEAGEIAHYGIPVELLDRPSTGGSNGVPVKWNSEYGTRSAKGHNLPAEGAKQLGEGYLILTSKRLIFKGAERSAAVAYSPQAEFFMYGNGIRLQRQVGNTMLLYKSSSGETSEIVGELLAKLMRDGAE
jgi:hypothetical protein